jgi:aminobutyraldehyde dehydrogenase
MGIVPSCVTSVIDGAPLSADSGERVQIVNPADESPLATWTRADAATAKRAVDSASRAFEQWSRTTPRERSQLLLRLAARLEDDAEAYARLDALNMGMPLAYARKTVEAAIDTFRFFAGAVRAATTPSAGDFTGTDLSMVVRRPVGVVAAFLPWNVPTLMAAWKLAPALAAGNCVIAKPSEVTPLSSARLAECASDVLPPGVLNMVLGTPADIARPVLEDDRVRMVTLTGGTPAGQAISEIAAHTIKQVHLELGGKGIAVVCDDADLNHASAGIARGALDNSGQDCTAAARIMTLRSVGEPLLAALRQRIDAVRIGNPMETGTTMGPLATKTHFESVKQALDASEEGRVVVKSAAPIPSRGYFMRPAIVYDADSRAPLCRKEVFGPVMTVELFDSMDDLLREASAAKHRLGASVWTSSVTTASRVADQLPAGKVWVNNHHVDALEMPHSGSWLSGYGVEQSIYALHAYQTLKTIYLWKGAE